jgi:hypothetical protein
VRAPGCCDGPGAGAGGSSRRASIGAKGAKGALTCELRERGSLPRNPKGTGLPGDARGCL